MTKGFGKAAGVLVASLLVAGMYNSSAQNEAREDNSRLNGNRTTNALGLNSRSLENIAYSNSSFYSVQNTNSVPAQTSKSPLKHYTKNDEVLLAKMIFGETRQWDCPYSEKVAAGWTAVNRVNAHKSYFGYNLHDVLVMPNQYGSLHETGKAGLAVKNPQKYDPVAWELCQKIATGILEGRISDSSNGATYFIEKSRALGLNGKKSPAWVNSPLVARIETQELLDARHFFYKEKI